MATVSFIRCPTEDGAERLLDRLVELQKQRLIEIQDAAIIAWSQGTKRPRTRLRTELSGTGALDGTFWGTLLGTIFFMPLAGTAIGAAVGSLTGSLADYGLNDTLIEELRRRVTEGTSALFLMSDKGVLDKIVPAVKDIPFEITSTNLSKDQEERIRVAFGQ